MILTHHRKRRHLTLQKHVQKLSFHLTFHWVSYFNVTHCLASEQTSFQSQQREGIFTFPPHALTWKPPPFQKSGGFFLGGEAVKSMRSKICGFVSPHLCTLQWYVLKIGSAMPLLKCSGESNSKTLILVTLWLMILYVVTHGFQHFGEHILPPCSGQCVL